MASIYALVTQAFMFYVGFFIVFMLPIIWITTSFCAAGLLVHSFTLIFTKR